MGCFDAKVHISLKSEKKNLRKKNPSGPIKHKSSFKCLNWKYLETRRAFRRSIIHYKLALFFPSFVPRCCYQVREILGKVGFWSDPFFNHSQLKKKKKISKVLAVGHNCFRLVNSFMCFSESACKYLIMIAVGSSLLNPTHCPFQPVLCISLCLCIPVCFFFFNIEYFHTYGVLCNCGKCWNY